MKDARKRHYTIAVMVGDTQSDYSEELMRGFYTAAQEEGVNIVLLMGPQMPTYCTDIVTSSITGNYRYQFNSIYQYTHFIKPDAAIVSYGTLSAFHSVQNKDEFLEQFSDIPCLVIEDVTDNENVPYLAIDNYGGMYGCVEHLIVDHGYRKIGFLSGPMGNYDAEERLRGYRDCMEKHGLEITDTMIEYGDYTDTVEAQANALLDNNPGLEAIAVANDGMTKACYRVCTMRNLIVGQDIAITGFDDITSAITMNPPLTSVSQRSFLMSYRALKSAVAMCKGEKPESCYMPTMLKKRCSCGCNPINTLKRNYVPSNELESFLKSAVSEVVSYVFSSVSYEKDYNYLKDAMSEFFDYVYDKLFVSEGAEFSMDHLLDILKKLVEYRYVSNEVLVENIVRVLQILLANAKDGYSQAMLASAVTSVQQFVHSLNIERLEKEIYVSNRKSWFVPAFTRDLASESYMRRPQDIFYRIMEELEKMGVRSSYLFTFDEPVVHIPDEPIVFPEHVNLVSYFNSNDLKFFYKAEQPKFTTKEGIMSFVAEQNPACLTSVILFSEQKQYGLMLCDVAHDDIAFLQICSMQLGTLFHFIELNLMQKKAQRELENSMEVIEEQNKILSFISEYDELTKLMNRRGFMEKALAAYKENEGKRAFLIFGDLDHLKQINDIYGHKEGDFSIKNVAERFHTILPENAMCGRIGGDEFVAFLVTDEEDFRSRIEREFAEAGRQFNATSDKPYYIEMSLGIYECICSPDLAFDEIIKKSDELLYAAKAVRRKNVQKEIS